METIVIFNKVSLRLLKSERSSYLHSPNILLSSVAFAKNLDILIFAETQHGIGIGMVFQQSSAFRNDSWKIKEVLMKVKFFFRIFQDLYLPLQ